MSWREGLLFRAARALLMSTVLTRNLTLPLVRGQRYVFVYHDISEPTRAHYHPIYSTAPEVFRLHIEVLSRLFDFVSLPALVGPGADQGRRNLASIVFDDGFESVYSVAFPLLSSRGIPFTVFANQEAVEEDRLWCTDVVLGRANRRYLERIYRNHVDPDLVDFERFAATPLDYLVTTKRVSDDYTRFRLGLRQDDRTYMTRAQIQSLRGRGVTIGSHTTSHKVLSRCSDAALQTEIGDNGAYLRELLSEPIDHFALPFGFEGTFDYRAVRTARAQHRYVYSTQRLPFRLSDLTPSVLIPRIGLRSESREDLMVAINLPFFIRRNTPDSLPSEPVDGGVLERRH